jgi:hypothetical protein
MKRVFLVFAIACGSATPPPPTLPAAAPPPAAPPPVAGQIVETRTFDDGAMHLRLDGSGVPLARTPVADWLALPMTGAGSIHVDLRIPVVHGESDLRGADGEIALACTSCQVGDDATRLRPGEASGLMAGGVYFGHLRLDRVAIKLQIQRGQVSIAEWTVTSPDLELALSGHMTLGRSLDDSTLEACVRFQATPALRDRDPRTYAVLATTGAAFASDGQYNVHLTGSPSSLHRLAQVCDGSQPIAAAPQLPSDRHDPPIAPDTTAGSNDDADATAQLVTMITKVDDHSYDIDHAVLDKILANPLIVSKGARVVPAIKDGKPDGFKLYAIRPDSLFAHLGLLNGDTLVAVNGFALTSIDKALEVYTKLRDATAIEVELVRRGAPVTLKYVIR